MVAGDEHGHRTAAEGIDETTGEDATAGEPVGFRTWGASKDHRTDLPQVVVGMAVTRSGIPVWVWCWPGNVGDQKLIALVNAETRDWTLARIAWVADRGGVRLRGQPAHAARR